MTTTFKKIRAASQSYGRGMDNVRTPGSYAMIIDGVHVATICAERGTRQFEAPIWQIIDPATFRTLRRFYTGGFRAAKTWAADHIAGRFEIASR